MRLRLICVSHLITNSENLAYEENDQAALLFIDVNLGEGKKPRIVLYEGDDPDKVAKDFAIKHCK